mmetsp:Transcript_26192/g.31022  ORF Transcript_26192/g.31022 Transcript_26192/m.31022 type:complete len:409 (-) Transcript_26192:228-1454(-)
MQKAVKINWKETNVALIGTDLDHKIKKAAAEHEEQWTNISGKVDLRIWRIEKFIVVPWPKEKYGKFHTGDSYVILNSYKKDPSSPKISYDLHIWIGDESSQDEYGTAAYKMVECDEVLDGAAIQHRETQGHESKMFLDYFQGRITYLAGGVDSGFHHVEPTVVEPHLYRIKGKKKKIAMEQLKMRRDELNSGDVFILHAGDIVYLWMGSGSNKDEKTKGREVANDMAVGGGKVVSLDQGVNDSEEEQPKFWNHLPGKVSAMFGLSSKSVHIKSAEEVENDDDVDFYIPELYTWISIAKGMKRKGYASNVVTEINGVKKQDMKFKKKLLNPKNIMLLDSGFHIYLWFGNEAANSSAQIAALGQVNEYLTKAKRPQGLPVSMVKQNQKVPNFDMFFYESNEKSGSTCIIS